MQKHKEIVRFLGGGCVRARVGSVSGEYSPPCTPLALQGSSIFLLRNPYYFPYFRLARFDSRPDFDLISLRI